MANKQMMDSGSDNGSVAKKTSNKTIIVLVAANSLILLAVLGYLMFSAGSDPDAPGGTDESGRFAGKPGPMLELEPFIVNLNEPGGDRYLRIKMDLEVSAAEVLAEIESRNSQVRDQILGYLSSLKLIQTHGMSGKEEIRLGVMSRVNAQLGSGQVVGVYFTEFVVQ